MIREYERPLTTAEQKALGKEIEWLKRRIPGRYFKIGGLVMVLFSFVLLLRNYTNVYLFIGLGIISFFVIWYLRIEIHELIRVPRFIKNKSRVITDGVVLVREINVDRYIKINNYEDEGNYFIIEYEKKLSMVGGQEFLDVRKLKNRIEEIKIMDSDKQGIYYTTVKKHGNNVEPFHVFKHKLSENFTSSALFQHLLSSESIPGTLEDLVVFVEEDTRQRSR